MEKQRTHNPGGCMFKARMTALLVPFAALVALAASPAERKDPVGVYALIDSVKFFPSADNAERVQLWGVFSLPDPIGLKDGELEYVQIGIFHSPRSGYLYYTLHPDEAQSRADWAEISTYAGTGRPVAFGSHWPRGEMPFPRPARQEGDTTRVTLLNLTGQDLVRAVNWFNHHNGRLRPASEPLASPDTFRLRTGYSMSPDRTRPAVAALFLPDIPSAGH
jgi:hypothetical protein